MTRTSRPSRGGRGRSRNISRNSRPRRHKGQSQSRRGSNRKTLDPHQLINKDPKTQVQEDYTPTHTFADFGFIDTLNRNLKEKGYVYPTRIQDQSIPHILKGKDLIGLANTGSGKTATFVLPLIHKISTQNNGGSVLVITPTRELAQQIQEEFQELSRGLNIFSVLCVGGMPIFRQIKRLQQNPQVIVGTPGRLKDLIQQNKLRLNKTSTLVLDETDRILDMGFLKDIRFIIDKLPQKKQSLCFSATMTPTISDLLTNLLVNPVNISVRTSETGEHIAQDIIRASGKEDKIQKLKDMLAQEHFEKVLVFGEMKHSVQKLANELSRMGFPSEAIHGNKTQPQRQRALRAFKNGDVNILVATDVAARGLDIPDVSHVINFDQPRTYEEYIHRIGRTGRAGKPGQAYTFV